MGKTSAAQIKAAQKWQAANVDRLSVVVPKGERDEIKAAAAAAGESVNAYIIAAIRARMAGTPATVPTAHPAAEQPAPKPKQPQQAALEDLLEQQKKKLAEQTEEIKRREAEKAEAEARKEAERQQREKEAQEFLRQFVEQFNREQARLAGEGKPFKEWRDLYDQDQSDILHAASFRDYREVSTLQELTPRERKARGFPLFDEKPKNF